MKLQPLNGTPFGAAVENFDCARIDATSALLLRQALDQHQVLLFRAQSHLDPAQEVSFCRAIDTSGTSVWRDQVDNPWERFKVAQGNHAGTYQLPGEPAVLVLGQGEIDHYGLRVDLGGSRAAYGEDTGSQVLGGGDLQWHIDGTFYAHEPCNYTQMRCIEAPAGAGHWSDFGDGSGARLWCPAGATAFASGRLAYRLLDDAGRRRAHALDVHYLSEPFQRTYQLGNTADGLCVIDDDDPPGGAPSDPLARSHPLVWSNPATGEHALMAHPRCLHCLAEGGRYLGRRASRELLQRLMRPAIEPQRLYVHDWRAGDLLIWDNRSLWHSATGRLAAHDRRVQHLTAFNSETPPRDLARDSGDPF